MKGKILFSGDPTNLDPMDYHFINKNPDINFNPARNKAIIEKTIADAEAQRARKLAEHDDEYAERADAVVSYLKHLDQKGQKPIDQYFGKRTLAYLRGLEVKQKLYEMLAYRTGASLKESKLIKPMGQ